jgi:acetate kinase
VLGFEIDQAANALGGPKITKEGVKASAWVMPTNEDLMIARHCWTLLGGKFPHHFQES